MRIVGLSGRIASGKSTVSNLFKSHGVPVVDADVITRDALKKWKKVVATFGEEILLENGEVNRPMLGQIVFPILISANFSIVVKLWLKGYKVIVLDVPLLFEAKIDKFTKPIIVVWIDPETQKKRLMGRDKSNEEDAGNRINAQMPLDVKRNKADIVIDNSGSLDDLKEQFQKFQKVLIEVSKPLTGTRFQEWSLGHASLISGLVLCIKALS